MSKRPKTFKDVVEPIFPDATEKEAKSLMWNQTAFPFMGTDEKAVEHYRFQLAEFRSTLDGGLEPCEMCNQPGIERWPETVVCDKCWQSPIFDGMKKRLAALAEKE
jgi:hypothetical protein